MWKALALLALFVLKPITASGVGHGSELDSLKATHSHSTTTITSNQVWRYNPYSLTNNPVLSIRLNVLLTGGQELRSLSEEEIIKSFQILTPFISEIDPNERTLFYERLIDFIDFQLNRLSKVRVTQDDPEDIEPQYREMVLFVEKLQPYFSREEEKSLKAYQVSFLIGLANILGAKHKNFEQLNVAAKALSVTNSLNCLVKKAYADNRSFKQAPVINICNMIILRARRHIERATQQQ